MALQAIDIAELKAETRARGRDVLVGNVVLVWGEDAFLRDL